MKAQITLGTMAVAFSVLFTWSVTATWPLFDKLPTVALVTMFFGWAAMLIMCGGCILTILIIDIDEKWPEGPRE